MVSMDCSRAQCAEYRAIHNDGTRGPLIRSRASLHGGLWLLQAANNTHVAFRFSGHCSARFTKLVFSWSACISRDRRDVEARERNKPQSLNLGPQTRRVICFEHPSPGRKRRVPILPVKCLSMPNTSLIAILLFCCCLSQQARLAANHVANPDQCPGKGVPQSWLLWRPRAW